MRHWILVVVVFALAMAVHPTAQAKNDHAAVCTLKVSGMTCSGCEAAVRMAAKRVIGVTSVTASAKSGTAKVSYDASKTSPEAIAKAVTTHSGFKTEVANK
ncbi:MAG TPA: cation transporter [Vicinamibacterales bacterium]|nr:cation transporter [Vicinamibacterales bacterium]